MIKKNLIFFFLVTSTFLLVSCSPDDSIIRSNTDGMIWNDIPDDPSSANAYLASWNQLRIDRLPDVSYSNTNAFNARVREHNIFFNELFRTYHRLTHAFSPFQVRDNAGNVHYIHNVYFINNNPNTWIEVDERLYNILYFAYEFQREHPELNFSLFTRTLSAAWENFFPLHNGNRPSQTTINTHLMRMRQTSLDFRIQNGVYHVKLLGQGRLDLGSVTKGYVTQLMYEYLTNQDIQDFIIDSGSSSLHFGRNIDNNENNWRVGISHTGNFPMSAVTTINVPAHTAISTTGISPGVRRVVDGQLYSHTINIHTGSAAVSEFGGLSIITSESALSDLLSTALFHLSLEEIKEIYPKFGIEIILLTPHLSSIQNPSRVLYMSPSLKAGATT